MTLPSALTISRAFARGLRAEIGAIAYRRVVATIRENPADPACPSHDYCDANVIMDEAMRTAGVPADRLDGITDHPEVAALWNSAWNLFRASATDDNR